MFINLSIQQIFIEHLLCSDMGLCVHVYTGSCKMYFIRIYFKYLRFPPWQPTPYGYITYPINIGFGLMTWFGQLNMRGKNVWFSKQKI